VTAKRCMNTSDASGVEAEVESRAAALLPADLLHGDEIVILMLRPSVWYIPLSCLTSVALIALFTFCMAYLARWQPRLGLLDTHAFIGGFALGVLRLGWQALDWWCQVYVLTDRRIIRRMGVLRVSIFQTSLKSIQHTSVFTRVRERLAGLGTIGFATSGSDTFEAFWVMVARPYAVHKQVVKAIQRFNR